MDYQLCGWKIDSAVALPELLPWTGPPESPDITLTIDAIPPLTGVVSLATPFLRVAPPDAQLTLPAAGCFVLLGGRRIIFAPADDADASTIRLHVLGSVFGLLCLQRGMLPLHGAGVRLPGGVVVILGASGVGKSTLATALMQRGIGLVSDDVCVIDPASNMVLPAFPRLRLWRDSAQALGWQPDEAARVRPDLAKYAMAPAGAFDTSPVPVLGFVLLHRQAPDIAASPHERLKGMAAMQALTSNIFRRRAAQGLGRMPALLASCFALASLMPVYRLSRGDALSDLPHLVDQILAWFGGR